MTLPRERAPYSAIVDRPPLPPLPGGNRIVFWTIVNVEVWDITRPMPRVLPRLMPAIPCCEVWVRPEQNRRQRKREASPDPVKELSVPTS